MSLLTVKDLEIRYPVKTPLFRRQRYLQAVRGVSFTLERGETLGLVGESGCGKSTLGKALVGLEKPCSGSILINGQELTNASGRKLKELRKKFQMIFQDPYSSLNPRMTIFETLSEVLNLHCKLRQREVREKSAALLQLVGLPPELLDRYPSQFSGGQRQRIGIARALATEPDFIVADEPVSALDVSVQASIVNLLQEIQQTRGTAFLFIAHDLAVVEHISRKIMVMYLGNAVEYGPTELVLENPLHPYTRALLSAVPALKKKNDARMVLGGDVPSPLAPPAGCAFHPRCPFCRRECSCRPPLWLEAEPGHFTACPGDTDN